MAESPPRLGGRFCERIDRSGEVLGRRNQKIGSVPSGKGIHSYSQGEPNGLSRPFVTQSGRHRKAKSHYTAAVVEDQIVIERVLEPTAEHVDVLAHLLPQLSSAIPPSLEKLRLITANPATYLFVARHNHRLVASLSLVTFVTATGVRAWIEDVVVDSSCRGQGIASLLVKHALEQAGLAGANHVDLTSRPERVEANRLYRQLGFSIRETNVYRFFIEN